MASRPLDAITPSACRARSIPAHHLHRVRHEVDTGGRAITLRPLGNPEGEARERREVLLQRHGTIKPLPSRSLPTTMTARATASERSWSAHPSPDRRPHQDDSR